MRKYFATSAAALLLGTLLVGTAHASAPVQIEIRKFVFSANHITIAPGTTVVWINDESVSRRHARIRVGDDGVFLEDLGSKNGTFLRGVPVARAVRLEDGDEFTIGEMVAPLRFHSVGSSVSTRTGTRAGKRARLTP